MSVSPFLDRRNPEFRSFLKEQSKNKTPKITADPEWISQQKEAFLQSMLKEKGRKEVVYDTKTSIFSEEEFPSSKSISVFLKGLWTLAF